MQSGITIVKAKPGLLSMFAGINGYQHLWFVPVDLSNPREMRTASINGEGELLQKAYQPAAAFRCGQCKSVVLVQANQQR